MRYDAVIFDLYGTLIDYLPEEDYQRSHYAIAAVFQLPAETYWRVWRETIHARDTGQYGGLEQDFRHVCEALDCEPTEDQLREAFRIRLEVIRRNLMPRTGAIETLTQLRAAGYRVGLVSDCASEIPMLWDESAFVPLIEARVFSVEMHAIKPEPRNYLLVCEQLGVVPERCLYIGDGSSTELTGARNVGMDPILICVPHERHMVMERDDPRRWQGPVIESLPEVLTYLKVPICS